jgi:hypothetical protein
VAISKKKLHDKIKRLVKKYGRVQMYLINKLSPDETNKDLFWRRRWFFKKGKCIVSYKGPDYEKFSGYQKCCFYYPGDNLDQTIDNMLSHDKEWIRLVAIKYGKGLNKTFRPSKRLPRLPK